MYQILVVENNQGILNDYIEIVSTFFPNQVTITPVENQTDALANLNNPNNDYAGAIIDLRLDPTETDSDGGNEILRQIKQNLRFPIFVLSGHTEDLDDSIVSEEPLFNKRVKGGPNSDFKTIVNEIIAINKTGITNILSRNGRIEELLKNIFWKHLAPTMPYWIEKAENASANTQKSLLRYTLAHLQEYLEQTEQGDFENYHPIEFYIAPPIKIHDSTVFTADVFKETATGSYYIVLTPSCDLVNRPKKGVKAQTITLAIITDFSQQPSQERDGIKNNTNYMHHFLPNQTTQSDFYTQGGVINFSNLKSVPLTDLLDETKYKKVFAISQSFKKDIIARFSHYYARQGQPGIM